MSTEAAVRRVNIIAAGFMNPSVGANSNTSACNASSSHFAHITVAAPDAIFLTASKFKADTDPKKIDLGVGAYRTDEGKPLVLNVIKKAEQLVVADKSLNHEYLPIDGCPTYNKAVRELLFGADHPAVKAGRVVTAQTLSGTGSLRLGAEFVAQFFPKSTVLISNPTWGNHNAIFQRARMPIKAYRYWDPKGRKLDIEGMLEDIRNAPPQSVILLHACAHNPTGVDPTPEQWAKIAEVIKQKNHITFFDSAYQGFASGDLDRDAHSIRAFAAAGLEMIVCQSFAKNFGLYNERIGSLSVVVADAKQAEAVSSQIKIVVRPMYSNPPAHGAHVVRTILTNPQLFAEWKVELKGMADRIKSMRQLLVDELKKLGTPGDWSHIVSQIGMFSFTGLSVPQCKALMSKYHIYLLESGRISMAGINNSNVKYLAKSIHEVVTTL